MLGIESIRITPEIMVRAGEVECFKGVWETLDTYTTGLNMLQDVSEFRSKFDTVFVPLKYEKITANLICTVHRVMSAGKEDGSLKTEANDLSFTKNGRSIGTLETAAPEQARILLEKLAVWTDASLARADWPPLITIGVFLAVFLQISPFARDNHRTAKFMLLLLMMKAGYAYAPFMTFDAILNERAREFYDALKHNQESLESGAPDWSVWLRFFFSVLQDHKDALARRLRAFDQNLAKLPALSSKIMKLFDGHQRLGMKEILTLTNARRSTVKLRLNELVKTGYLKRHGNKRATWYALM